MQYIALLQKLLAIKAGSYFEYTYGVCSTSGKFDKFAKGFGQETRAKFRSSSRENGLFFLSVFATMKYKLPPARGTEPQSKISEKEG